MHGAGILAARKPVSGTEIKEKESFSQLFQLKSLDRQDTWYPTLRRTVWVLSQLHDFVKVRILRMMSHGRALNQGTTAGYFRRHRAGGGQPVQTIAGERRRHAQVEEPAVVCSRWPAVPGAAYFDSQGDNAEPRLRVQGP